MCVKIEKIIKVNKSFKMIKPMIDIVEVIIMFVLWGIIMMMIRIAIFLLIP